MKFDDLIKKIQETTKDQWKIVVSERVEATRRWIQESPEVAALAGFLMGFIVALAFKVFIIAAVIVVLMGFIVWSFAPDSSPPRSGDEDREED